MVSHVLSDDAIISNLERQFGSELTHDAGEIAGAHRYASINRSQGEAVALTREAQEQIARSGKSRPVGYESMEHTMTGAAEDAALEPEIAHAEDFRNYTAAEATVVLAALRQAASTPGYRQRATDILAHYSPSRTERLARRTAAFVGKLYMEAQSTRPYRGRHRA